MTLEFTIPNRSLSRGKGSIITVTAGQQTEGLQCPARGHPEEEGEQGFPQAQEGAESGPGAAGAPHRLGLACRETTLWTPPFQIGEGGHGRNQGPGVKPPRSSEAPQNSNYLQLSRIQEQYTWQKKYTPGSQIRHTTVISNPFHHSSLSFPYWYCQTSLPHPKNFLSNHPQ